MDDITVRGDDGSIWRYHAICGPEFSMPETGWVLVVEGASREIPPQAITAGDVLGDLESMMPGENSVQDSVRFFTGEMIDALDARARQVEPAEAASIQERADGLRRELAEALRSPAR